MAKQYVKTEHVDEVLGDDARHKILTDAGEVIYETVQIQLDNDASPVVTPGTNEDADVMNNIEDGIDMLDTIVNQDGVRLIEVDGATSDPDTLTVGTVLDGQFLMRDGNQVVGGEGGGGGASLTRIWVAG